MGRAKYTNNLFMATNLPPRPAGNLPPVPSAKPASKAAGALIAGLVVGLVAGYGAGRVSTGGFTLSTGKNAGTYAEGYEAARKKIADSGIFPPAPSEMRAVSGAVKSVGADSFVMTTDLRTPNPLEEIDAPKERTVTVTADTKIYRQVQKSPEEQQKEFAQFQKAMTSPRDPKSDEPLPTPPQPYKQEAVKLSELKPGDMVVASAAENIMTAASFTATEVSVTASAEPPSPPQQ